MYMFLQLLHIVDIQDAKLQRKSANCFIERDIFLLALLQIRNHGVHRGLFDESHLENLLDKLVVAEGDDALGNDVT